MSISLEIAGNGQEIRVSSVITMKVFHSIDGKGPQLRISGVRTVTVSRCIAGKGPSCGCFPFLGDNITLDSWKAYRTLNKCS